MSPRRTPTRARTDGVPSRPVLYLRQSLDRKGEGVAVARQREECLERAARLGWAVTGEYVDNSVSATSKKPRPEYLRLIAAIESGEVDGVIVWDSDRLHRKVAELEAFILLIEARGIPVAAVTGNFDLLTASGRLNARILVAVAANEQEHKAERQHAANDQAAAAGKVHGSHRAFGYAADRVTVKLDEARAVQSAYDGLLAGDSLRGIARQWNAAGLTTTFGNVWSSRAVRAVLMGGRYAGLREHLGEIACDTAEWPALVSRETWETVVAMLADPARKVHLPATGNARRHLLAGIATCGLCGDRMASGSRTNTGRRLYKCPRHHLAVVADAVDEYVVAAVRALLSRGDDLRANADAVGVEDADLAREAAVVAQRVDEAADMWAAGEIDRAGYARARARLAERAADIDARRTALGRSRVLTVASTTDALAHWDDLDIDRRRAIIDSLVTITLASPGRGARRFNPDTITLEARG